MRVVGATQKFINCDVSRLTITTRTGMQFVIFEKDGALRILAPRAMFVQWDGDQACEVRQLRKPEK